MARDKAVRRVALAVRAGVAYVEEMFEAIFSYARTANWTLTTALDYWPALSAYDLRGWKGDGVIAWINTPKEAKALTSLGLPAINVSGSMQESPVPRVILDNRVIGRMAVEYLYERGFRRFAYYGVQSLWFSQLRQRGFIEAVETLGGTYNIFDAPLAQSAYWSIARHEVETREWLAGIKPPFGVLAIHDYRARRLIEICHDLGLRVPDDVAVIGVNNDRVVCEHCEPQLTSIARNGHVVGRAAAEMLDQWMRGRPPKAAETLFAPGRIVTRGSTEVLVADDPLVNRAIGYMQQQLHDDIDVARTAYALDVSRRSLERAFQRSLKTTPHEFLSRLRVKRARALLEDKKIPLFEVARRSGFSSSRHLQIVFERHTGQSPRYYRYSKKESI